jgi:uncharacterized membrane protein
MKPLFVLVAVFVISLFITRFVTGDYLHFLSGKIAMAAMLLFTAMGHFVFTKGMTMMVPNFVPFKKIIVYFTGVLEIIFAIGLLLEDYSYLTAWLLIAFLILMTPSNIKAAIAHVDYQRGTFNGPGPNYLWFRLPMQLFLIAWVYFFALSPSTFFFVYNKENSINNSEKFVTFHGSFTVEEDDVEPPFTDLKSRFKTLESWLTYICQNERPSKTLDSYNFGLIETEGQNVYTLYLVGKNTYEVSEDYTRVRIEFSPKEMYFRLPESEYYKLNREQVLARVKQQISKFRRTNTYKNSFLQEANQVKTEWNGETWSN